MWVHAFLVFGFCWRRVVVYLGGYLVGMREPEPPGALSHQGALSCAVRVRPWGRSVTCRRSRDFVVPVGLLGAEQELGAGLPLFFEVERCPEVIALG